MPTATTGYGNGLVADAGIVASEACAEEMAELPPSMMAAFMKSAPALGAAGAFLGEIFRPFDFEGIEVVLPDRTFSGELDLRVGDRPVKCIEVGPAHTRGDVTHRPFRHCRARGLLRVPDR